MEAAELVVGPEHAGERLDVFLAPAAGSRAAAQRLIDAGLVLVDGAARPKRHAVQPGEKVTVAAQAPAPEPDVPDAEFEIAYEDEHLLVVDKPAGVVVHPARGHHARHAGAGARRPRRRRRGPAAARDRAPPRPTYLGPAGRRAHGSGARRAEGHDAAARGGAGVRGAGGGSPGGPRRHHRRPGGPRPARADARLDRHRRAAPGDHALRGRAGASRTSRCCACGSRPAARTRSAPTCWPSGIRWPATPNTAASGVLGLERQFLHAERLAFRHPVTGAAIDVRSPLPI